MTLETTTQFIILAFLIAAGLALAGCAQSPPTGPGDSVPQPAATETPTEPSIAAATAPSVPVTEPPTGNPTANPDATAACPLPSGDTALYVNREDGYCVKGADKVLAAIEEKARIKAGETTADNQLSLLTARCIVACGIAPAVVYDGTVTPRQTPESALQQVKGWIGHGH